MKFNPEGNGWFGVGRTKRTVLQLACPMTSCRCPAGTAWRNCRSQRDAALWLVSGSAINQYVDAELIGLNGLVIATCAGHGHRLSLMMMRSIMASGFIQQRYYRFQRKCDQLIASSLCVIELTRNSWSKNHVDTIGERQYRNRDGFLGNIMFTPASGKHRVKSKPPLTCQ